MLPEPGTLQLAELRRRDVLAALDYHCGQRPIPPCIGLACRGWEALQAERNAA